MILSLVQQDSIESQTPATWPEARELPPLRHVTPELEPGILPEGIRDWVEDIAQRMSAPLAGPAVAAIIAAATVVGRKLAIRPKEAR